QATATDKVGNTFTGAAVSFILDNVAPTTASVTTPAGGSAFRAATVPATFSGSVADNSGGVGLNANSTTFTLQRSSDNNYWTGSAWQAAAFSLAATNSATTGSTAATWTSSATLPTWASESDGTYTVQATATDKAGNTFTGTAVTFTLDNTNPITASVTAPIDGTLYNASTVPTTSTGKAGNTFTGPAITFTLDRTAPTTASVTTPVSGSAFRAATVPATFSGSAADNTGGSGLNANSTTFTLQRSSDSNYWTGSGW